MPAKTSAAPATIEVTLVLERETKGTYRYMEVDPETRAARDATNGAIIGTLYIRKTAFPGGAPRAIQLSILSA